MLEERLCVNTQTFIFLQSAYMKTSEAELHKRANCWALKTLALKLSEKYHTKGQREEKMTR